MPQTTPARSRKTKSQPTNGKHGGRQITVSDPLTGKAVGEVPILGDEALRAMADKGRRAFEDWSQWPFQERAELVMRFQELVIDRLDELLGVIRDETGKSPADPLGEILAGMTALSYYCKKGDKLLSDERRMPYLAKNKVIYTSYKPMGLAGVITPWNFPFEQVVGEGIPAILAGCTVILKPSEVTPLTALWIERTLRDAGLPDGVFQIATGDGSTGAALIKVVDRISFTGSTATGRKVAVACAERLIPCTLELGGKDAVIVCEDADLERTANALVFGAFFNAGQMCTSIERVYAMDGIFDELVDKVVARTGQVRFDPKGGDAWDMGSITFPPQLDIIERHVADAVAKGARVLTGGKRREDLGPLMYEPTVLVDVTHDMLVMREETFGPVLPIMRVHSDEEAVRLANDSPYGLNSGVWSSDVGRAKRLARRIVAGTTEINDTAFSHIAVESPFGGVHDSGIGRRRGPEGLRKFCHSQTVTRDLLTMKTELWWYPLPKSTPAILRRAFNLLFRRGITGKLLGR